MDGVQPQLKGVHDSAHGSRLSKKNVLMRVIIVANGSVVTWV
jgi:hypothetical protein